MRTYGPRGSVGSVRRARRAIDYKRLSIFIGVIACAVIAIVICVNTFTKRDTTDDIPTSDDTNIETFSSVFADGVSVGGINVSGMSVQQAKTMLSSTAQNMLQSDVIEFTVQMPEDNTATQSSSAPSETDNSANDGNTPKKYSFTLADLGVAVDIDASLNEAIKATSGVESKVSTANIDFPLKRTINASVVKAKLDALAQQDGWIIEPVNAKYKPAHYSSEENLTTWGEMVTTDSVDGYSVDTENLFSQIQTQVESGVYSPIEAKIDTVQGTGATDTRKPVLLASATTSFDTSPEARRYNIWKISDKLNGVTLKPGVEFSVNEHVGDRNAENGWKQANGIENGVYTPQYGGGICQVSSTMYNAALKAGMDIVSRVPHTIMAAYVKPGLDATISTGGPDFKVENPYDSNLYMIVNCSVPDRKVTVEIWGYEERNYTVELYSELISDKEEKPPVPQYKVNQNLGPYEINEVRPGRRFEKYQLLAKKIDKETGKVIEEGIKMGTSTYNEIPGVYEVGIGVPITEGMTIEEAQAAAAAAAQAAQMNPPTQVNPLDPGVSLTQPVVDGASTQPTSTPATQTTPEPSSTQTPAVTTATDGGSQPQQSEAPQESATPEPEPTTAESQTT